MGVVPLFLVPTLIWSSTWLAITFQLGVVAPEASVAYRFALAALLIGLGCLATGRSLRFSLRHHALFAAQGALFFGLNYIAIYRAEQYATSGLVAVLFSTIVIMSLVGTRLAFGTPDHGARVDRRRARCRRRRALVPAGAHCRARRRRHCARDRLRPRRHGGRNRRQPRVDAHAAAAAADRRNHGHRHGLRCAGGGGRGDTRRRCLVVRPASRLRRLARLPRGARQHRRFSHVLDAAEAGGRGPCVVRRRDDAGGRDAAFDLSGRVPLDFAWCDRRGARRRGKRAASALASRRRSTRG